MNNSLNKKRSFNWPFNWPFFLGGLALLLLAALYFWSKPSVVRPSGAGEGFGDAIAFALILAFFGLPLLFIGAPLFVVGILRRIKKTKSGEQEHIKTSKSILYLLIALVFIFCTVALFVHTILSPDCYENFQGHTNSHLCL